MRKILISLSLLFGYNAYADLFTTNVVDGCSVDNLGFTNPVSINAVFEPKNITCSAGYFLPANNENCEMCSDESTCTAGTYTFNETKSHGIVLNNTFLQNQAKSCDNNLLGIGNNVSIRAVFEPMNITCRPGYYLTANNIECSPCLIDNKCIGGTYSFNETNNQGIEQCANGHAPAGSSVCYEHILHIGDDVIYLKSIKLTTPSLNVGMDDGIFYANMTTTPTPMNAGTEHYLKIEYDGTVYYVCDDSTYTR